MIFQIIVKYDKKVLLNNIAYTIFNIDNQIPSKTLHFCSVPYPLQMWFHIYYQVSPFNGRPRCTQSIQA